MFKLQENSLVWWPVTLKVPADGGNITEHEIEVQFDLISQDEFDEIAQQGDITLLKRFVKGWKSIGDKNGQALEFNEENANSLYQIPYIRSSILYGYMNAVSGAPAKN
jgi:hypothetical protein